jgi:signal transduction histidine kinase
LNPNRLPHNPPMPPPPDNTAIRPHDFLKHGLVVVGFNSFIGLVLALNRSGPWQVQMIYSQAIGLSIWALMDFGRLVVKINPQTGWPEGWRRFALQGGAIFLGYLAGSTIGDALNDRPLLDMWRMAPRAMLSYLLMCIAVSAAISFFFYARGKDQMRLRQLAAAQRDVAETQLKLLESQLEPHMLFNTLANLRVLIALDPPRAQTMLDQLIAFLRATLSASRATLHPLSAEFARVGDYLELMKVRMGDRLQPEFDLPPGLAAQPMPPLLLQPLVENAIKHGLEPHVEGGRLVVSARRDGDALVLTVRNTGAGLSAAPADGTHFGLEQVRQRLATLYGEAASLTLAAADDADGGTLATVRLPGSPPE